MAESDTSAITLVTVQVGSGGESPYEVTFPVVTMPRDGLENTVRRAVQGGASCEAKKYRKLEQRWAAKSSRTVKNILRNVIPTVASVVVLIAFGVRQFLLAKPQIIEGSFYIVVAGILLGAIVLDTYWRFERQDSDETNGENEEEMAVQSIMMEYARTPIHSNR